MTIMYKTIFCVTQTTTESDSRCPEDNTQEEATNPNDFM